MSFAHPYYLLGIAFVPVLWLFLFWAGQSRERALAQLGDSGLINKLAESLNERGRRWQQRLWLLALGLIIFALARPQWGTSTQVVQQEGIQIMVALDVSASMLAQDLQPDRLTRAKQTISELMDQLNGDQIGLVLFSGASFVQFPLTNDYATAKSFLSTANPGMISRPGTVIAQAIRTARQGFDDTRSSQKVIVVMTDGENHEGDVLTEAQNAADNDIIIYTLGFGSAEGEPIPNFDRFGNVAGYKQDNSGQVILTRLDETTLKQIADLTGGNYFRASASGTEIVVLADLIDRLESAELESRFEVQAIERFPLFLFIAIFCLVIAELIPERRQRARRSYEQLVGMLLVAFVLVGCRGERGAQLIADGNQQFEQASFDEALVSYSEVRAAGVDSAEPIYNTANVQYRQDQYPEAVLTLEEALLLAEGELSAEAWFNLGNTHFFQQEWDAAVEAYKATLRITPDDVDAKYNLELALNQIEQEQQQEEQEEQEQEEQEEQEQEENNEEEESDQADQEEESGEGEEEEPAEESTPTPEPESNDEEGDESEEPAEDNAEQELDPEGEETADPNAAQTGDLSEEQALQLLDAIEQGTETLQERLQQTYTVPGPPPSKDY